MIRRLLKRYPRFMFNLYPPLLGAGIRITHISTDWKELDVEMKLRWWNANYVGTQYGGSLYSLTDPFFMVMLIEILGRDYIVWDKSAAIRFRKPGHGTVYARFRITDEQITGIRTALKTEDRIERDFPINVTNAQGEIIAEVNKLLHFRNRKPE